MRNERLSNWKYRFHWIWASPVKPSAQLNINTTLIDVKKHMYILEENAQKDFLKKQAALVEPVSEIVYYEFEQKRAGMIAQKGAFTGAKYAAALWSAYALWDKEDSFKQIMAVAAFKGAAASIRSSDSVDLRHWSLLPDNIWQQSFYLPKGTYIMTVLRKNTPVYTQKVDIKGENIVSLDINLVSE